jgi:hypothetical protein
MTSLSDMTESQDERQGLPSASSWRRYELCAGSWQLENEARQLKQAAHERSPDAQRGELIHAWLAGIPDEDGKEIVLSDAERQTAESLLERGSGERIRIFGDEPVQQLNEHRLWLTLGGKKALSGRFDRVIWNEAMGVALVQDFKTGWSVPEGVENGEVNAQMRVLAVLCGIHLPPTIREIITQLVTMPFGIFEQRYDRSALKDAWDGIVATLRAINAVDAPLNPGVIQCQYCPAISCCQAVRNLSGPITKLQLSTLPEGGPRAAKLLDECAILEDLIKAIREHYAQRLTEDPTYKVPGYEMVPGATERDIQDWKTAKLRLAEYLDADQLELTASYGIGKIEAALAKALKIPKAQAKERFNQILEGLIKLEQKKASLKRVSGKKQVVTVELP